MTLSNTNTSNQKPSLLLHACCAPCSTAVYEKLCGQFDLTVFWYNPNIFPEIEHDKRLGEIKKLAKMLKFKLVIDESSKSDADKWDQTASQMPNEPEGGKRCHFCYAFRLNRAADYALAHNFDLFATTLTVSPYKNTPKILEIGKNIEQQYDLLQDPRSQAPGGDDRGEVAPSRDNRGEVAPGGDNRIGKLKFLAEDFIKNAGYQRSIELSKKFNLYRQNYCGCKYSLRRSTNSAR